MIMNNDTVKDNICNFLKEGLYKKDAALMAGIDESTLYRWIKEDASFASRVEATILEYKHSLIKNLTKHAENNAGVALQILRIRWPNDWDKPQGQEGYDISDLKKKTVACLDALFAAPECNHPNYTVIGGENQPTPEVV